MGYPPFCSQLVTKTQIDIKVIFFIITFVQCYYNAAVSRLLLREGVSGGTVGSLEEKYSF